ncbi:hypothetical protein ABGB12_12540 [Actinocorallia sp. B10E7]|uniref:hypothetical protein n=1 Tax=Actinocorallia sp. B10E7 TaxID=3153558 RepID=UPI00325D4DB4
MHVLAALSQTPSAEPPDDAIPAVFLVLMGVGVLLILVTVIALCRSSVFIPYDPEARDREWPT